MADDNKPLTMTVPEAGKKYFGLSRDGSYRAAERGDIPTIRIGRLLRVPVRAMERLLDGVGRTGADVA
jgi:excisionase family DNA binding protein